MKKIVDFEICDVIPFSKGVIFAKKEMLDENRCKVLFYGYDIETGRKAPVTKIGYQHNKFGSGYKQICDELGDYISCDATTLSNGNVVVVYPTGETGLFKANGVNKWSLDLLYHDSPIQDVVSHENYIWCTVPEQNAIISYSIPHKKFSMRIGGDTSTAFDRPTSLSIYGNELFVCNTGSFKVRIINLEDYSVEDFRQFDEPVYRYLRVGGKEIVWLESGVYVL